MSGVSTLREGEERWNVSPRSSEYSVIESNLPMKVNCSKPSPRFRQSRLVAYEKGSRMRPLRNSMALLSEPV